MPHNLDRPAIRRVAARALSRWAADPDESDRLFPQGIRAKLRRVFTPRGMPFFEFYVLLKQIHLGTTPVPEDLRLQFRKVANILVRVVSPVDGRPLSPVAVNQIAESRTILNTLLTRLEQGRVEDAVTWMKINEVYVPLIVAVARDKGLYLRALQRGRERWAFFRRMNPRQEKAERLKDEDPETYALMLQQGRAIAQIDEAIETQIRSQGHEMKRAFLMGRPVHIGRDPVTGEERVHDRDGAIITIDEYKLKRQAQIGAQQQLSRVPTRTTVPPSELRSLSDGEVDALEGEIEWAALTDDKAKQGRLTRIFATKRSPVEIKVEGETARTEHVRVIVSGRHKGIYLDDMVNSQGRLIEGTAYDYSPQRGKTNTVPKRIDPSQREPYVTVADVKVTHSIGFQKYTAKEQKLYLKIPGTKQFKELRDAMKQLACNTGKKSGCISSISYHPVEGSKTASFYFEAKDFGIVRDTLKGMSLSKGALEHVQTYFKDLARAEQATAAENLSHYGAAAIGGFKVALKQRDGSMRAFDFLTKQKQAMAWMDAKGNNGVCALDTGIGKTLVSIGMMQKMIRDGLADPDASYQTPTRKTIHTNGRFLFVCPKSLKGNLPKEVRTFLSSPRDLLLRLDIVSYGEFTRGGKSGQVPGSLKRGHYWQAQKRTHGGDWARVKWNLQEYVALVFDEASELAKRDSEKFKVANTTYHPHKILLTASPIEGDPAEAYLLASITSNTLLVGDSDKAKQNRAAQRRFMDRFTERIGGRIIGVKEDPLLKRDLDTWVKQNVYYADKTDVEEYNLPELKPETVAVQMEPVVEEVYREMTGTFARLMRGLVGKFRDLGNNPETGQAILEAREREIERVFGLAYRPVLKLMNDLANQPDKALRAVAYMIESGNMPELDPEGRPKPIPGTLRMAVKTWRERFGADQLRRAAEAVGNPKLQTAANAIRAKLAAADGGARTLLFSDDKSLCMRTGEYLAQRIPGWHAIALNDAVHIIGPGGPILSVTFEISPGDVVRVFKGNEAQARQFLESHGTVFKIPLPLQERAYRKFPGLPQHERYNRGWRSDRWQEFALKEVVVPNQHIKTLTCLGQSYQHGHNLQAFNTVIHLDRNTWSSENMKQRTARAWRQGQSEAVEEITLDATYAERGNHSDLDGTLDEIRRYFQAMEKSLFDRIVKDAQHKALGLEWDEIALKSAGHMRLDAKVLELMLSPFVSRSQIPGVS